MIENARRQLFLVLVALIVGVICQFAFTTQWGQDLKGGSQLRYEIPKDVLEKLTERDGTPLDSVMDQTIAVIRDRIDPTGTIDVPVTRSGELGIQIELPYFPDPQELNRVKERIANLGKLEMRMVADQLYFKPATDTQPEVRFQNLQNEKSRLEAWLKQPGVLAMLRENPREISRFNDDPVQGPLQFGNLAWYPRLIGPDQDKPDNWDTPYGQIPQLSDATVKAYEDKDWNGGLIPEDLKAGPAKNRFLVELIAINMHELHFTGEDLDPAGVQGVADSETGGLAVGYRIVPEKMLAYADWSATYINKCSAIILNGIVKSAPRFQGRIPGVGRITGDFTKEEVDELVKVLRTGSLRVEPELVSTVVIGPTLGAESIWRGTLSLLIGGVLVYAFMCWFYGVAGIIACITLTMNVFLLWSAMLFMQATITLPGLGGIVLTMGMAVDANVLIYERIREEIAKGKDLLRAVRAGFERAMSAILDSNITTFLVGLVLFNEGVGPVRGFAVTLMAGIVTTVFTQFLVTRVLFHYALERKQLTTFAPRTLLGTVNLDFVQHTRKALTLSGAAIAGGLLFVIFVIPSEVMLGLDFTGGADLRMILKQPVASQVIKDRISNDAVLSKNYPNIKVNTVEAEADGRSREFTMRLKLDATQRAEIDRGRAAWRELRREAEAARQDPPPAYEPPYLIELQRVFGDSLVDRAFSRPRNVEDAEPGPLQWSMVELNFEAPVKLAEAQQLVDTKKLIQGRITVPGDPNAAIGQNLRLEWKTQTSVRPWQLFDIARDTLADLKSVDGNKVILSEPFPAAQEIQGRLVHDLRNAAISALIISWGLIVLYLRVRFHEYKYGIAAVVALIHDVLVTFLCVAIANYFGLVNAEINVAMIACFLTVIGYSVNDTIVIFDRIRELLQDNARQGITEPLRVLINRALNQTLSRTLLTSLLTMFVVLAQFLVNWGSGSDLESFAFAMIIGLLVGVYSTIYIAAPILVWMHKDEPLPEAGVPVVAATEAHPGV